MKRTFFIACLMMILSVKGFSQAVSCDLSLSDADITNLDGGPVDANDLSINQILKVKVNIGNFVSGTIAPAGHFRLRIGLGAGLVLRPGYNIATSPLNNYFTWSYDVSGSQPQIIGLSNANLPADFIDVASFEVKANNSTTSTVSFNLLINNPQGTTTPLSDPAPANNVALNTYTVTNVILPVSFLSFDATGKGCNISTAWQVGVEQNVARYEVEVSNDARNFVKVADMLAQNSFAYNKIFPVTEQIKWPVIFVRVKVIDKDGSFKYSEVKSVTGACTEKGRWVVSSYPNPVTDAKQITIAAKEGVFNGKYKLTLMDNSGKIYKVQDVQLNNQLNFKFDLAHLMAAGKYTITIISGENSQSAVLEFEKL